MQNPDKAKYTYLENVGCYLFFVIGGICSAAIKIMQDAFASNNGWPGAVAVLGLSAMGSVAVYFFLKTK